MKTKISILLTSILFNLSIAQLLITTNAELYNKPDDSSILQIADNNKGFLLPRLTSSSKISSPVESVVFIILLPENLIFGLKAIGIECLKHKMLQV